MRKANIFIISIKIVTLNAYQKKVTTDFLYFYKALKTIYGESCVRFLINFEKLKKCIYIKAITTYIKK